MHRLYENEEITVFWDSDKCRHARRCVTGSPEVFTFGRKPWVDLSKGESKEIWQTVTNCPSGALNVCYNYDIDVLFEEEAHRSAAYDKGQLVGECDYELLSDGFRIYHTAVDPAYGGRKIAKRLVYRVVEEAEKRGLPVIPACSYAAKVLTT